MKKFLISIFTVGLAIAGHASWAGGFPTGHFDCSSPDWIVEVQIADSGLGLPVLTVHIKDANSETTVSGIGTIFKSQFPDRPNLNVLRLPGSRWEAYFDQNGNLGLTEDHLNCKH